MKKKKTNDNHKLPPEQYDPYAIQCNADFFLQTANRCGNEQDRASWLAIPEIVNRAFACELYMKAILSTSQQTVNGHNLKELFGLLPSAIQADIQEHLPYSQNEFTTKLKEISDIFEECRYTYEYSKMHIDLLFLRRFAENISEISHKLMLPILIARTSP